MNAYSNVASGYQAGQYPPGPFCLFGFIDVTQPGIVSRSNCFAAGDHITANNYEVGVKGSFGNFLQMSLPGFVTQYEDLPLSASDTTGTGFDTTNVIVSQTTTGIEWEGTLILSEFLTLGSSLGYLDASPDADGVVPLPSPRWTLSLRPQFTRQLQSGILTFRVDYSWRDLMYGEPAVNRRPLSELSARSLANFDLSWRPNGRNWEVALWGRNVTDKRYRHATLNTGDYVLIFLSNDPSEFGVRFNTS